jgi:hypothetical protein
MMSNKLIAAARSLARCRVALKCQTVAPTFRHIPNITVASVQLSESIAPVHARCITSSSGPAEAATPVAPPEAPIAPESTTEDQQPPFPSWLAPLKASVAKYPLETMAGFMVMDAGSIMTMFGLLTAAGVEIPVEFGVAFGISRMLRRPRLPIDATVAAVIAKWYPPLTQVNLLSVFSRVLKKPVPGEDVGMGRKAVNAVVSVVEKYGLALLVSQRMVVGLASVLTVYTIVHLGVDVQSHLQSFGMAAETLGSIAAKWAASACMAAPFFPFVLFGAGRLGLLFGRLRSQMLVKWRNGA